MLSGLQWTLEQHRFELCGSTYMWGFSINTYSTIHVFSLMIFLIAFASL